ncbi:MAG: DUF615 domain-containing protein [Oligoflexales bacterium]|nr:DUF615 domain-containing protein [Oligoflexales bacterium]
MYEPQVEEVNEEWVSKSQRKRDSKEILKFVETLAKLPKGEYRQLGLSDHIIEELENAISIKSPIARARQLKYVAKIIRNDEVFPELKQRFANDKSKKKIFR